MKLSKLFIIGCVVIASIVSSCGKNGAEPEKGDTNPLANTTWAADYSPHTLWIKFTSGTEFMEYMGDASGNPSSTGVDYGTYKYADNKVTFLTHDSTSPFDYANIKGSVMELYYKSGMKRTFIKK
jgi:hypothetical protein